MYLLSISFHVSKSILDDAIKCVREGFKVKVENSGIFYDTVMGLILVSVDPNGQSFSIQMKVNSLSEAEAWLSKVGNSYLRDMQEKWGDDFSFFTTPIRIMNDEPRP